MPTSYPLDITGFASANLVANEPHVLTEINSATQRIIIPVFAPFHQDNFTLQHVDDNGVVHDLILDVDYYLCLPFIGASRSLGKMVYGGVAINTNLINGIVKITYQTLGGAWCADPTYVLERIAERVYNPKTTVWDILTNVQQTFPPINHNQEADSFFGMQELLAKLNELAVAIASNSASGGGLSVVREQLLDELALMLTKEKIGLPDVVNLPLALAGDVTSQNPVDKYITLKQVLTLVQLINSAGLKVQMPSLDARTYYLMKRK